MIILNSAVGRRIGRPLNFREGFIMMSQSTHKVFHAFHAHNFYDKTDEVVLGIVKSEEFEALIKSAFEEENTSAYVYFYQAIVVQKGRETTVHTEVLKLFLERNQQYSPNPFSFVNNIMKNFDCNFSMHPCVAPYLPQIIDSKDKLIEIARMHSGFEKNSDLAVDNFLNNHLGLEDLGRRLMGSRLVDTLAETLTMFSLDLIKFIAEFIPSMLVVINSNPTECVHPLKDSRFTNGWFFSEEEKKEESPAMRVIYEPVVNRKSQLAEFVVDRSSPYYEHVKRRISQFEKHRISSRIIREEVKDDPSSIKAALSEAKKWRLPDVFVINTPTTKRYYPFSQNGLRACSAIAMSFGQQLSCVEHVLNLEAKPSSFKVNLKPLEDYANSHHTLWGQRAEWMTRRLARAKISPERFGDITSSNPDGLVDRLQREGCDEELVTIVRGLGGCAT